MDFFKGNNFEFDDLHIVQSTHTRVQSRRSVVTNTKFGFPALIPASMSYLDDYGRNTFCNEVAYYGAICLPSREPNRESPVFFKHSLGMTISYEELKTYPFDFSNLDLHLMYPFISVDIANGALVEEKYIVKFLEKNPCTRLIIGNFGNPHAPKKFTKDTQDKVSFKVGIGSGRECSTKLTAGVSYPQAALVHDTRNENPDITIISDGGIRKPADYVKAIALGADFVMAGNIFSRCIEANSFVYDESRQKHVVRTRGMASATEKGDDSYVEGLEHVEEVETLTKVSEVYRKYDEGLRSAMSYADAVNLTEFRQNVQMLNLKSQ